MKKFTGKLRNKGLNGDSRGCNQDVMTPYQVGVGDLVRMVPVLVGSTEDEERCLVVDQRGVVGRFGDETILVVVTGTSKTTITVEGNREFWNEAGSIRGNSSVTFESKFPEVGGGVCWVPTNSSWCPDEEVFPDGDTPGSLYKMVRCPHETQTFGREMGIVRDSRRCHPETRCQEEGGPGHFFVNGSDRLVDEEFIEGFWKGLDSVDSRRQEAERILREVMEEVRGSSLLKSVSERLYVVQRLVNNDQSLVVVTEEEDKENETFSNEKGSTLYDFTRPDSFIPPKKMTPEEMSDLDCCVEGD